MRLGHSAAHIQCGAGLSGAGNIIQFTFYGHHGGGLDVAWHYAFELAFNRHHFPGAFDQFELLENGLDGVKVVVRIHVQHGVVLVVELAVCVGAGVVTLDQVLEVVVMAAGMAIRVHGHETGMLQKPRIDTATLARKVGGNREDHIFFKPFIRLGSGQVVHRRGRLAGINRAAHHDHRQGCGFPA